MGGGCMISLSKRHFYSSTLNLKRGDVVVVFLGLKIEESESQPVLYFRFKPGGFPSF